MTYLRQDTGVYTPQVAEDVIENQTKELICYIWDNYIVVSDTGAQVFLMGVGKAYNAVKALLLSNRGAIFPSFPPSHLPTMALPVVLLMQEADCKSRIAGVVGFVTGDLHQIKSDVDPELSAWYRTNSRLFIGANHPFFKKDNAAQKLAKRRFGMVKRSSVDGANRMMVEHADDVQQWITNRMAEGQGGHNRGG